MLNRRILRVKVFKMLYSSVMAGNVDVETSLRRLDESCESTRDLYIFMLGIVSPLTAEARSRIDSLRQKFNPTEEERNPNMKFAENALAPLLDADVDFMKAFKKRKFSWEQYDLLLKKTLASVTEKEYYKKYMASPERSLAEDCRLFMRIFEEEFVESEVLEQILEEMSIYWTDDLAYALTWCCRTLKSLAAGERWELPPVYQSEMRAGEPGIESDRAFCRKLLQNACAGYPQYLEQIEASLANWERDRVVSTDLAMIVCGLAEVETCPTIPVNVTINEYVEISKYYGTPKSSVFVNGMLDRLVKKMREDGKINKN